MTTDQIAASNAPAAPRSFGGIARLLRHWLGISDQRHDFDALAFTLSLKDQLLEGQRRDLNAAAQVINGLTREISHYGGLTASLQDRLHYYEQRVPQLFSAKRAYDKAIADERKRRETLIADHPEWSDDTKQHVLQHGTTPGDAGSGNGHGQPAPNLIEVVQRMPSTPADMMDPDRLRLIRESEGDDTQADGA